MSTIKENLGILALATAFWAVIFICGKIGGAF